MLAKIIHLANITLDIAGRGYDAEAIAKHRKLSPQLSQAIAIFTEAIFNKLKV